MSKSHRSFRFATRSAAAAVIAISFFTLAVAGTSAAGLSFLDSVKEFFGLQVSSENAEQNAIGERPALSTTIVISQVYPGGGSSSPTVTYKKDYVELKNISAVSQSISGLSLHYGPATANFGSGFSIYTLTGSISLQPGQYYLVELGTPGTGGADITPVPDESTTNLSMSATNGKVALTNTATALGCGATATPCTLPDSRIIDLVAWGAASNGEGGTTVNNGVALPANTNGGVRKTGGCTETDDNNLDFDVVVGPVPRNSGSTATPCGGPTPTSTNTHTPTNRVADTDEYSDQYRDPDGDQYSAFRADDGDQSGLWRRRKYGSYVSQRLRRAFQSDHKSG